MEWNEKNLSDGIAAAETADLLDRVAAYRTGMEPAAIELIESELRRRGVSATRIAEHRERCERTCVFLKDGCAAMCSSCRKPAIGQGWGWHKLWGIVPILPRWLRYCDEHAKK